ncbi:MAG TPA: class I SAM-dependent methyltransferase [Candidatus Hydrogenedentes bacterium]|nr:class I SAM-dependent methyltransferase [Candidatus Hydrogenedentota bacterium]HIJ72679.1 class I SAM-dependent methyltransferase [Candidatus Hydrogenedentota bacterium]
MDVNRMYDELAYLWPLISAPEDYADEARYWKNVLRAKLGPGRHAIFELGVGGGNNLSHLTSEFQATAVDLSEQMLKNSRRLNPTVEHHVGDMRTVRLGKKFKAVLIHDAISYVLTEDDLRRTLATAVAHLEPNGVFVTAPDYFRETFHGPSVSHSTRSNDRTELTHIEYIHDPDPNDTTIESIMFYLIRENDGLRIEQDRHITGLFPIQTWVDLMVETGFTVEKWPYPVHEDARESYLLVGLLK